MIRQADYETRRKDTWSLTLAPGVTTLTVDKINRLHCIAGIINASIENWNIYKTPLFGNLEK